jgi:hypothetical protein
MIFLKLQKNVTLLLKLRRNVTKLPKHYGPGQANLA